MQFTLIKSMVEDILRKPLEREWTLQGFGMLRTYLPGDVRLHVWDDRYAVPDVSEIHDHPWHFDSLVVAGMVRNTRYVPALQNYTKGEMFKCYTITPGEGLTLHGDGVHCVLMPQSPETYYQGDTYEQGGQEIHRSQPERGSVTLVKRHRKGDDVAHVYCNPNRGFVSAEPRKATQHEIADICERSLYQWFAERK